LNLNLIGRQKWKRVVSILYQTNQITWQNISVKVRDIECHF
jgi:hypothetical protein